MDSAGKTLVTGATGFVGAAVARALIARGERVVLLARKNSPRGNVEGLDAEIVIGDLRDAASLAPVLRGVDKLYHVAADYRFWAPDPNEIIEANRLGVGNIMTEALRAGVSRIVYTSSVATLKLNVEGRPVDETSPATPEQAIGAYKKSKTIAERLVEKMVAEQGLPAVIVNPSTPIGPRDIKPTPTGRVIVEAGNGRMPGYVDTGLNLVHVEDVAAGHLLAMEKGRIGERYILGGQDAPLAAMLAEIATLAGRRPPSLSRAAHALVSAGSRRRIFRAVYGQGTLHHCRRSAHGQIPHVFFVAQGRARTRIFGAALRRCLGRCGGVVPRKGHDRVIVLGLIVLVLWLVLVFCAWKILAVPRP